MKLYMMQVGSARRNKVGVGLPEGYLPTQRSGIAGPWPGAEDLLAARPGSHPATGPKSNQKHKKARGFDARTLEPSPAARPPVFS